MLICKHLVDVILQWKTVACYKQIKCGSQLFVRIIMFSNMSTVHEKNLNYNRQIS